MKKRTWLAAFLALALALCLAPMAVFAEEPAVVYVSDAGSDEADGSQSAPVATLGKALELVAEGGTVMLAGDVSPTAAVIVVSPAATPVTTPAASTVATASSALA